MQNRIFGLIMCTSALGAFLTGVYMPSDPDYYFLLSGILSAWVVADACERRYNLVQTFAWAFASLLLAPIVVPRWYATRKLLTGEDRKGGTDCNYLKAFGIVTLMYTGLSCALSFLNFGSNHGFELIIHTGFAAAGCAFVLGLVSRKESVTETGRPKAPDAEGRAATARAKAAVPTSAARNASDDKLE
jgi:hypothetical protein